jgi:hypothetical protein
VLHGTGVERTRPSSRLCSGDADGLRTSQFKHLVQGLNCNGDLSGMAVFIMPFHMDSCELFIQGGHKSGNKVERSRLHRQTRIRCRTLYHLPLTQQPPCSPSLLILTVPSSILN